MRTSEVGPPHVVGDRPLDLETNKNIPPGESSSIPVPQVADFRDRAASLLLQTKEAAVPFVPWLAFVWSVGVLLLSAWNCAAWIAVLRLKTKGTFSVTQQIESAADRLARQLGLPRVVRLLQSFSVESPIVAGAWKPVILLPASLITQIPPDQLEALLAHELAHVLRRDYLVNLLQTVVETLLFYHPGVWWISSQVRREREVCCDDLALRVTSNRAVYVRALSAVVGVRAPLKVPAANGGLLIPRLHRILGIHRPESAHPARWLTGVAMLSLCGIFGVVMTTPAERAIASPPAKPNETTPASKEPKQPETPQPTASLVNMLCVDAEGKPVAGAEIHLFQYDGTRYVAFGPYKSDEQGKATCAQEVFSKLENFDRWIYARVPGRLVGVSRCAKWTNRKAFNAEGRVRLYPSTSIKGEVKVAEGFDPANVNVRVKTLWVTTGPDDFDFDSFAREDSFPGLDTALPEIFERHPDAEGRIQFDDVPVKGRLFLVTVGDGLAEAQWRNDGRSFDKPIQLTISKESGLSGRVLTPSGEPAIGMNVGARLADTSGASYLSTFRAVTNENGEFTIHGLPQKEFVLAINDPQKALTFRPLYSQPVPAGERRNLELDLETGVIVSGQVFDPDGKPVAGAAISALSDDRNNPGLGDDMTDAEGRYQFRIPTGKALLYFNSLPDGFAYPRPQVVKNLDVAPGQADIEKLNFTLQRQTDASE